MIDDGLIQALEGIPALHVRPGEPMSRHTTFRVGGPAELWLLAESEEAAVAALRACKEAGEKVKYWTSEGAIVRDGGLPGIWMTLGAVASGLTALDDGVRVGARYPAAALGTWAIAGARAGLEATFGRAGTVADAWRAGELGSCVRRIRALRGVGAATLAPGDVSGRALPIWLELSCPPGDPRALRREARARVIARRGVGPGLPGRIFADPPRGTAAGAIAGAGLCGVRLRHARIGRIEPNNIINLGGATARDLGLLMQLVRDRVKQVSGVEIKPLGRAIGRLTE